MSGAKKKVFLFDFSFAFFKKTQTKCQLCSLCHEFSSDLCEGGSWLSLQQGFYPMPRTEVTMCFPVFPRLYLQHDNPEAVLPEWWGSDWCSQGPSAAPGHLQPGHRHPLKREPARWEPSMFVSSISWMPWLQIMCSVPPCLTSQPEGDIRKGFELAKSNLKSEVLVEICIFLLVVVR